MNVHDRHRQRVRDKFIHDGPDGFEDYRLLELLLFYSIPRRDTNETAHRLINRFGSIYGVLNASAEELASVTGVGPATARYLKLIATVCGRYSVGSRDASTRYDSIEKIGEYLTALYTGIETECVYLLLFNNKCEMLDCLRIADGSINSAAFGSRVIIEKAVALRASGVVLAHNHPTGVAIPSGNDMNLTARLDFVLDQAGIRLVDHFIVADGKYSALIHRPSGNAAMSNFTHSTDDFLGTLKKP